MKIEIFIFALALTMPVLADIDINPYISFSTDSTGRGDSNNLTNRMIISWGTSNPCPTKLEYGTTTAYGTVYYNATNTKYHHVQIPADLSNLTKYYYQAISTSPADTVKSYFYSPNSTVEPQTNYKDFTFCVYGNSSSVPDTHSTIWNRLVLDSPTFVIHLGDLVSEPDGIEDWKTQYFNIISGQSDTLPIMHVRGDKEYGAKSTVLMDSIFSKTGPRTWLGSALDWITSSQGDSLWGHWWVFNYGPIRFVGWNSNTPYGYSGTNRSAPSQAQWSYLTNHMALNPLPYTFVFCHESPYSSGGALSNIGVRDTIASAMVKLDSQVMFSANNPFYQRAKITPSSPYLPTTSEDIYFITSGGGGEALTETPTSDSAYVQASSNRHHYVRATVTDDSVHFDVLTKGGAVLDHFSVFPNFYIGRPFLTFYVDPDTSIRVNWRTVQKGRSRVCYGTSDGVYSDSVEVADSVRVHSVDLVDLTPNTKYFYRVFSFSTYSKQDTFWTAKTQGDNSEFQTIWSGDFQFPCQHNLAQNIQMVDSVIAIEEGQYKRKFSFWGCTGDLFGMFVGSNIYEWAQTRLWGPIAGHMAIMDTRGNMDYFELSYKTLLPYNRPLTDAATYSFKYQNYNFIAFDVVDVYSTWHEDWRYGTDQWTWLNAQLDSARVRGEKVVLFSHITPFHSSPYPTFWSSADTMYKHIGALTEKCGHCLWLYGHTHVNASAQRERALEFATTRGQSGEWERIVFNAGVDKNILLYRSKWAGVKDSLYSETPGFRANYHGSQKISLKSNIK